MIQYITLPLKHDLLKLHLFSIREFNNRILIGLDRGTFVIRFVVNNKITLNILGDCRRFLKYLHITPNAFEITVIYNVHHINKIDSMLPCVCSLLDHR